MQQKLKEANEYLAQLRLLRSVPIVVSQHTAKPFAALNADTALANFHTGRDDLVVETLMITFAMVMFQERIRRPSQRVFTKRVSSSLRADSACSQRSAHGES